MASHSERSRDASNTDPHLEAYAHTQLERLGATLVLVDGIEFAAPFDHLELKPIYPTPTPPQTHSIPSRLLSGAWLGWDGLGWGWAVLEAMLHKRERMDFVSVASLTPFESL